MKYKVDGWNNFCRVFLLPETYPEEFCFNGGHPVNFQMVDWFNPVVHEDLFSPAISKESWIEKEKRGEVSPIIEVEIDGDEHQKELSSWLIGKNYIIPGRKYLFISKFGLTFIFGKSIGCGAGR